MLKGTATYASDDLTVHFTATGEWDDVGVPGAPRFIEWDNYAITSLEICGVGVDQTRLPLDLQDALVGLAEYCDFEVEPEEAPDDFDQCGEY